MVTACSAAILKKDINLIGVDGSEYGLDTALERGYNKTILVEDFCTSEIPIDDSSIDLVICKDLLEHLLDPVVVVSEISRLLKPRGVLFLHVPNHFSLKYRLKFLFTNNIDTQNYFPDSSVWNFPHIRFFSFEDIIEKFSGLGFSLIENYSGHFASFISKTDRVPFLNKFQVYLAQEFPSNFSNGFSVLLRKNG